MNKKIKTIIMIILILLVNPTKSNKNKENQSQKKIDKPWDKIQKEYAIKFVNWIFKYYEIDEEVISEKNSELTTLKDGGLIADFVGESKHGYNVNIEFQTNKPKSEDMIRFAKYALAIKNKYKKGVRTYVLSREKSQDDCYLNIGPDNKFRVIMINFKYLETNKILNKIEEKVKNNKQLNEDDLLFLKVGFITSTDEDTYQLLMKLTEITNKIQNITQNEINDMKIAHAIFAQHLLEKEQYEKIMEMISMRKNVFEERYEKGREDGKEEEKKDIAKTLLENGTNPKEVSKITKLPLKTIQVLMTK